MAWAAISSRPMTWRATAAAPPTLRRSAPGQAMSSFLAVTTGAFHANPEPMIPGVPEPGAWALMLIGFDSAGAMLRARRRVGGRV